MPNTNTESEQIQYLLTICRWLIGLFLGFLLAMVVWMLDDEIKDALSTSEEELALLKAAQRNDSLHLVYSKLWHAQPISKDVVNDEKLNLINYGRQLIQHTAKYLGPKGSVAQMSNGMNCQNCHLEAGTKPWGNNYGAVFATYPKYRARSGTKENIYKRINDCFERSLNGKALEETSKEMQAIKSYIEYIGSQVPKDSIPKGAGIFKLPYLDRPADLAKGEQVYQTKCSSCHQADGQGLIAQDEIEYTYPPLWGPNSYNHGAGLYRLSRLAGYVKYNMPLGATYIAPQLTDEESWDVAAFVNTQSRPSKDLSLDWPKVSEKPVDHPFGPFTDPFSEKQHKFGPFKEIETFKKQNSKK